MAVLTGICALLDIVLDERLEVVHDVLNLVELRPHERAVGEGRHEVDRVPIR